MSGLFYQKGFSHARFPLKLNRFIFVNQVILHDCLQGLSVNEFLGLEFCGQTSINAACPGMEMALSQATISDENEGDSISRAIMKFLSTPETADKLFSQQLDIW